MQLGDILDDSAWTSATRRPRDHARRHRLARVRTGLSLFRHARCDDQRARTSPPTPSVAGRCASWPATRVDRRGAGRRRARHAAVRAARRTPAPPWWAIPRPRLRLVAVTGTNGKTSVTTIVGELARRALVERRQHRHAHQRAHDAGRARAVPHAGVAGGRVRSGGSSALGGRDGGVESRHEPAPRRRARVHRGRVHQPLARTPRLPRLDGGVLRREVAPLHARALAPRRASGPTTPTAIAWPRRRRLPVTRVSRRDATDVETSLAGHDLLLARSPR